MSIKLMTKAFDINVGNPVRKLVLIKLADNADDNGMCFPSYQHIADKCNCSRKTVINHVKWLCANGYMTKTERKVKANENQSNIYKLDLSGENLTLGREGDSPRGVNGLLGGENPTLGGGVNGSPRTVTSFNHQLTIIEPIDKKLADYRRTIGKPIKTDRGLAMLKNAIAKTAKAWSVPEEKVVDYIMDKEWQSVEPTYQNPFTTSNPNQQKSKIPAGFRMAGDK